MAYGLAVSPPDGSRTWTVVDANYRTVAPVEEWLEAHHFEDSTHGQGIFSHARGGAASVAITPALGVPSSRRLMYRMTGRGDHVRGCPW
jgi:hypothetical protein